MKLLITGFEPFGGETVNPSWEAVALLPDQIGSWEIVKLRIPVEFGRAAAAVLERAKELRPDVILSIGQAGGRGRVTPEVIGINLREGSIPDNAGVEYKGVPIHPDGPAAWFSTVPVRAMVEAGNVAGIPCALSYSAGAYVCNDVLYTLLRHYDGTDTRVGFIHVPFLPEQAKNGESSLPLSHTVKALEAMINAL